MVMSEQPIVNIDGKKIGSIALNESVFDTDIHEHLLWEIVKWQRACKRSGNHSTKRRSEVSGSTRKPYKQKGTGRARHGSHRSPIWVGGGSVFGPKPRNYAYSVPRKVRREALRSVLSVRAKETKIIVMDAFLPSDGKTKQVVQGLSNIGVTGKKLSALIVDSAENKHLIRATYNLKFSKWIAPEGINVYDVLDHDYLVMTQAAIKEVEKALMR